MSNVSENTTGVSTLAGFEEHLTSSTPAVQVDLRVARYCVFGPIFVFSVTGNTLVILTVLILRKMRTVPMIFVANLAACDLTTTISSIAFDLPEAELGFWPYGGVLCKIIWPLATFSTNAAALTLVAISIDRFVSIICPLNLRYRITRGKCLKMILAIYCISALAVTPYSVILKYSASHLPACKENWPEGYYLAKIYTVVLFALQYGLPLIVMSVIYTRIGLKLCKNSSKAAALSTGRGGKSRTSSTSGKLYHSASDAAEYALQKRKRQNEKTAKMFLFVVVIFLVFMMPHQLLWLSHDFLSHSQTFIAYEELISFVCRAFTYANSVLNPIIYGVCNGNFRRGCLAIVKCQCSKASQRSQARKQRTESFGVKPKQKRLRSDSTFRSTTTMDSVTSALLKETKDNRDQHLRKEVLNKKVTANGFKNSAPSLSNGSAPRTVIRDEQTFNESAVSDINANCFAVDRPMQHNSAKPNFRKSLYENTSRNGVFNLPLETKYDTSYWLSETEALLNRLCQELDVDTTGEKGARFSPQRDTSQGREKYAYGCNGRETIL